MATKKYKPKFATMLKNGMRKDGMIIDECCVIWGVSRQSYSNWIKEHPKFKEAAEIAETHYNAWFARQFRLGMTGAIKMNAGMMTLAAKNILGYVEKVEVNNHYDEKVSVIKIEQLPTRAEMQALPEVIEGEILE